VSARARDEYIESLRRRKKEIGRDATRPKEGEEEREEMKSRKERGVERT
jgi:hypothetical protein